MCIEEINQNREQYDFKSISGDKNIMLLETLAPKASFILTYNQWLEMKRTVCKGEHKLLQLKGANKYKNKKTNVEETKYYNFNVFDITHTRELTEEELEELKRKKPYLKFRV